MCRVRRGWGAQGWGCAQGCWEGAADEGSLGPARHLRSHLHPVPNLLYKVQGRYYARCSPGRLHPVPPTLPRRWTPSGGRHGRV